MSNRYRRQGHSTRDGGMANIPGSGEILAGGITVPSSGAKGYAPGCLWVDVDATSSYWYMNTGTRASCTFTAMPTSTQFGYLTGVVAGTAAASKALVLNSSSGIATITSATITTLTTSSIGGGGSTIAITDRMTTTDGVASGTAKVIGGLAYSNTAASTAIASTSAETVFDTNYTLPVNTLKAGTVVKVRFQGIQTTEVGSDTLAFKLYIGGSGGTALITSAATAGANSATIQGEATIICRTAGTTGTFVSTGTYKVVSAEGTMTVKDDITASTTINTQAQQLITCTGTFNTTNANSVRMDVFTVEIY